MLVSSNEAEMYFIEIFFDISTFDKVEQDKKMTIEAQLGLIGGTMGLLTGFSILSGVEIIYYAIRFFASLRVKHNRRDICQKQRLYKMNQLWVKFSMVKKCLVQFQIMLS